MKAHGFSRGSMSKDTKKGNMPPIRGDNFGGLLRRNLERTEHYRLFEPFMDADIIGRLV